MESSWETSSRGGGSSGIYFYGRGERVWRWRQNATGGGGRGGERGGGAGCETRSLRRPPAGGGRPFNSPSSSSELEDISARLGPAPGSTKLALPPASLSGRAACPPPNRARARPPFRASVNCRLSCQALHVLNLGSWNDSPSSLDQASDLVFFFAVRLKIWVGGAEPPPGRAAAEAPRVRCRGAAEP